eukprot:gene41876-51901_t
MRASFSPNNYTPSSRSSFLASGNVSRNASNSFSAPSGTPSHRSTSQITQDLFSGASPSRRQASRKAKTKMTYNFNDGDFNK